MKYIIIGCGNAGFRAALKIRELTRTDEIILITNEDYPPYCRCLLTYFIEDKVDENFLFSDNIKTIKRKKINFLQNTKVDEIEVERQIIKTADNKKFHYDKLLIATGGTPVIPSFENYNNTKKIFTLRTLDDAKKIKENFKKGDTVVLEGGGLVSLKTLLSLYEIGIKIKWIVKSPYILSFVLDEESSSIIEKFLKDKDIEIYKNDKIIYTDNDSKGNVVIRTEKNKTFLAKGVIVGKGVKAVNIKSFDRISFENGYKADEYLKAYDNVYVAGDCSIVYDIAHNKIWRIPLWPVAGEQGIVAANNMVRGDVLKYEGAISVNSFSVFENNIIAGGKKKIEVSEKEKFFSETSYDSKNNVFKKLIFNKQGILKGYVLINDIRFAGNYLTLIKKQEDNYERVVD